MNSNTDTKSKILSEQTVFQSKLYKIDRTVIKRNGKTFTKDIIKRNPNVVILPVTENDEIYFVSQYRDAHEKTLLELPAGNMESVGSPLDNAKRELKEETGLTAKTWKQIGTFYTSANINGNVYVFVASDLTQGKTDLEDDEDIRVLKIPLTEAIKKIESGEINVTSIMATLLLFEKMRKEGKI